MGLETLTDADKTKIKQTVEAGVQVLREIETLREDMKTYVNSLAEEFDIKPTVISKAVKLAHKNEKDGGAVKEAQDEMTEVEVLLEAAGKI